MTKMLERKDMEHILTLKEDTMVSATSGATAPANSEILAVGFSMKTSLNAGMENVATILTALFFTQSTQNPGKEHFKDDFRTRDNGTGQASTINKTKIQSCNQKIYET